MVNHWFRTNLPRFYSVMYHSGRAEQRVKGASRTRLMRGVINPTAIPAYMVQNPNCCQNPCGGCNGYGAFA